MFINRSARVLNNIKNNKIQVGKFGLGGSLLVAPLFLMATVNAAPSTTPTNAYVASGGTGDCTTEATACATFSQAMTFVTKGGTIFVAAGSYTEDINITKDNITIQPDTGAANNSATVTSGGSNPYGDGVSIVGQKNITISGLNFVAGAGDAIAYDLHAYQSPGLTLTNDNFTGTGATTTPHVGGVDVNSSSNVTESNVTAENFSKNGFAFTAKYASGDTPMSKVSLTSLTSEDNAWSGIAFYTTNGDGTVGGNISGVTFTGTNTVSGNGQTGVFLEGGSDANLAKDAKPAYAITGPNSSDLKLGSTDFSKNYIDVFNYASRNVNAKDAKFNGILGNNMNTRQRRAEEHKLIDNQNYPNVGQVVFFSQARPKSPKNGITLPNAGYLRWYKVPGAVSYNYESANSKKTVANSNQLANAIYTQDNIKDNYIDARGTAPGTYYWQAQPVFQDGSTGSWSVAWQVNVGGL